MRKYEDDLDELCVQFTAQIVHYLGGIQAGLYLQENGQNDESAPLILKAWYAGEQRRFRSLIFEPGEGLVGEVFREKATRTLERVPEGYAYVESGLGATEVKYILLVPIVVNEQALGVLEIAALHPLEKHKIEFAESVAEDLAGEVLSILVNQQTRRLLQEAQIREEAMRAQEEEMRQNMEELQATQEEMQRKESEIRRMLDEANVRELELKESLDKIEDVKDDLERKNKEVERMKEEEKRRSEIQIQTQKELIEKLNRKNEEAMQQAVLLRKKEEELSAKVAEMEEVQVAMQKQNKRLKANEDVLKKAFEKSKEKDKTLKQTLKEAEIRERKLQHIIDAWPHLLVILNANLEIERFNETFAARYRERGMEAKVGDMLLFQLPENQRENYSQYFLRVLEDGEDVRVKESYEDQDGTLHHFYTELHPLRTPSGEIEGLFITSQEKKGN
jgi:DNA repair exonuclease SbcCD ATPase subunit